jgi:transposase-like protein
VIENLVHKLSPQIAPEGAKDMSAPCPRCRAAMVFVTALPHPHSPEMRRTVFLCTPCNQTRNYSLSAAMAEAYAVLFAPPSEPA